jgi:hypothetical protein
MFSLNAIPEPSNNAPKADAPEAVHQPLAAVAAQDQHPVETAAALNKQADGPDADQQVDSVAVLLVLLIAGALLRLVLGLLGPLQGIETKVAEQAQQNAKDLLAGNPADAYPVFDLLAHGAAWIGLPGWTLVLVGSLLTLLAIPAAFVVGQALTGRRAVGTLAAALLAVHPAVLTASNSFGGSALALSLVTLGLAVLCFVDKRHAAAAIPAGVLLGLAALAAPLCWIIAAAAGPLTFKLAREKGAGKAIMLGGLVVILALAPVGAYRALMLGTDTNAILVEFADNNAAAQNTQPIDRVLVTITDTSFEELGIAMHLPLGDAGRLNFSNTVAPAANVNRDVVADTLADGWLLLNAALAGFAAISVGVMLVRRRWAEILVLALPLTAMAFCTLEPNETLRLPLMTLVGTLSIGLLATRSVPRIDKAKQEAKLLAKQEKREAKEREKQERELAKHKDSLYAFDRGDKSKVKPKKQATPTEPKPGILSQQDEELPVISGRPI